MDKITEYYLKIDQWAKNNPKKAALIVVFVVGFLIGAIIF